MKEKIVFLRTIFFLFFGVIFSNIFIHSYLNSANCFPLIDFSNIKGVLAEDSKSMLGGKYIYKVKLSEVNNSSTIADCTAIITILSKNREKNYMGQFVTADVSKIYNNFFFSNKIDITSQYKNDTYKFRGEIIKWIVDKSFFGKTESAAFFEALFLGNRDDLSFSVLKIFEMSGCQHLIALSGMHLAIIISIFNVTLKKILHKKFFIVLMVIILTFYVFIAGSGSSLKRAWLMFLIPIILDFFNCKIGSLNVLSVSFVFLSILFPMEIFQYGFILSFSAVAGILLFSKRIEFILLHHLPKSFSSVIAVSYSAQLFVVPILFFIKGEIAILGVFASIISSPFLVAFLYIRIFSIFIALFNLSGVAFFIAKISDYIFFILEKILIYFSTIGMSKFFPFGWFFFLPIIIFILKILLKKMWKKYFKYSIM